MHHTNQLASTSLSAFGLLVQTKYVPIRIAESGSDFRSIHPDRLHDFAAVCADFFDGVSNAVHHYIYENAGIPGYSSSPHPAAAHFANAVIKRCASITTRTNIPAKHVFVKRDGSLDIGGWNFNITNFPVRKFWRHFKTPVAYGNSPPFGP